MWVSDVFPGCFQFLFLFSWEMNWLPIEFWGSACWSPSQCWGFECTPLNPDPQIFCGGHFTGWCISPDLEGGLIRVPRCSKKHGTKWKWKGAYMVVHINGLGYPGGWGRKITWALEFEDSMGNIMTAKLKLKKKKKYKKTLAERDFPCAWSKVNRWIV